MEDVDKAIKHEKRTEEHQNKCFPSEGQTGQRHVKLYLIQSKRITTQRVSDFRSTPQETTMFNSIKYTLLRPRLYFLSYQTNGFQVIAFWIKSPDVFSPNPSQCKKGRHSFVEKYES